MKVKRIALQDYRNFENLSLELAEGVNIFWGDNAQGKTNFLESLYVCASGRSHRTASDRELIRFGCREAHLQALLAENPAAFGEGWTFVQREYPTPIGPVDIVFRDDAGLMVAVEVKRRGEIDGVEQLTRYLTLMNADPLIAPVRGVFAAQLIKPQARVLASTRGIDCLVVDYDLLRGLDHPEDRLF